MSGKQPERYLVGIDLGTTNTAVAYIDRSLEVEPGGFPQVDHLPLPQLVGAATVEARTTLPSFVYLPGEHDEVKGATALPWGDPQIAVGIWAQQRGAQVPDRLISSAKSWLCHDGVNRQGRILPWGAGPEAECISPVSASARLLEHVCSAWEHAMECPLKEQQVLLAVPASFDAVARDLTVKAAEEAGLSDVTLIEEPQAAFYAWLAHSQAGWREQLAVGDLVLVCDLGGGTTDFSLIQVEEEEGNLVLERIAVGDHLLLGGDNMDLALAHRLVLKLKGQGKKMNPWQARALWYACREAKEQLLSSEEDAVPVTVLGRGSRLLKGTLKTELTREELQETVLEGFFPLCKPTEKPERQRRAGLQEIGLEFAADPAVTRHLAAFLTRGPTGEGEGEKLILPSAILFNGGVLKGEEVRARLLEAVNRWLKMARRPALKQLQGEALELAVANGAAYYGYVREGKGIRIRGGTARSYYVGIESAMPAIPGMDPPVKALCVAPFGMEEGTTAAIPKRQFGLLVGEEAEFRFFASTRRLDDEVGVMLEEWDEEELTELAPLEVCLEDDQEEAGTVTPVRLQAHVTAVGTLELWCVSPQDQRWKLEFNVRHD